MHELFVDPFASHVYQAILHTLAGRPQMNLVEERTTKRRRKNVDTNTVYAMPESFSNLRSKVLKTVKKWDLSLLQTLVFDKYAVPLLQVMIEIDVPKKRSKKSKEGHKVGKTLTDIILFGKDSESDSKGGPSSIC
jgi:hypothetical protein